MNSNETQRQKQRPQEQQLQEQKFHEQWFQELLDKLFRKKHT